MRVSDLMKRDVHCCGADDTLAQAAAVMWDHDCGCVPVVSPERVVIGMLTDRDVCMAALTTGQRLSELRVSRSMARTVKLVRPEESVERAERIMWESQVRRLPVVDGARRLVGIISLNDIARHLEPSIGGTTNGLSGEAIALTLAAVSEPRPRPS